MNLYNIIDSDPNTFASVFFTLTNQVHLEIDLGKVVPIKGIFCITRGKHDIKNQTVESKDRLEMNTLNFYMCATLLLSFPAASDPVGGLSGNSEIQVYHSLASNSYDITQVVKTVPSIINIAIMSWCIYVHLYCRTIVKRIQPEMISTPVTPPVSTLNTLELDAN